MITQELLCSRVLLKYKRRQRKLLTQTSEGGQRVPHSLVLARELYIFSIGYNNKSKGWLKVVKVLPDPFSQHAFEDNRIGQKVLKEKHVLKQDPFLLYNPY